MLPRGHGQRSHHAHWYPIGESFPVVDGILWWKWPTNMEFRKEEDRRFVPAGKKAEQVIEKWFKK